MVGLPDFRAGMQSSCLRLIFKIMLKSLHIGPDPIQNPDQLQPNLFLPIHSRSRLVRISDPNCILIAGIQIITNYLRRRFSRFFQPWKVRFCECKTERFQKVVCDAGGICPGFVRSCKLLQGLFHVGQPLCQLTVLLDRLKLKFVECVTYICQGATR